MAQRPEAGVGGLPGFPVWQALVERRLSRGIDPGLAHAEVMGLLLLVAVQGFSLRTLWVAGLVLVVVHGLLVEIHRRDRWALVIWEQSLRWRRHRPYAGSGSLRPVSPSRWAR